MFTSPTRLWPIWFEIEFEAYLRCGILAHSAVLVKCTDCGLERPIEPPPVHPARPPPQLELVWFDEPA